MSIIATDTSAPEEFHRQCKCTLEQLLMSLDKQSDRLFRSTLRLFAESAFRSDLYLGLSDPRTDLGSLMQRANERSRLMGFL
jgi:hypothetical protein